MPPKQASRQSFSPADEQPLEPGKEGEYGSETYNLWVHDPTLDIGLNIWFASNDKSFPRWVCHAILFEQGGILFSETHGEVHAPNIINGGNGFLTLIEPFKRLRVDFIGMMAENSRRPHEEGIAAAPGRVGRMELAVDIGSPPIEQGSQGDAAGDGDGSDTPAYGHTARTAIRYEQLCRVTGPIRIGDRTIELDAYGVRSHRRNSTSIYANGAIGHSWIAAFFPDGRGVQLLSYQMVPDAAVGFLYCHYFDGERYREAEVERYPFFSGKLESEAFDFRIRVDGKVIEVMARTSLSLAGEIPCPAMKVPLTRSSARYMMDGMAGGGVLERSLGVDYQPGRYFAA